MTLSLKFCGAAETVTGSCYLFRYPGGAFLVDCGLFQGPKRLKELNYAAFPFDPKDLSFVLLTHAHIDHSGLLPKLIKQGFGGPIYATAGSRDLLSYMLPDSGYIQESEVEHLNRRHAQRGLAEIEPIYTRADGQAALHHFRGVEYEKWFQAAKAVRARFWNAGHILGSASIEIEIETGKKDPERLRFLFSGDIGPEHKLFHPDPEGPSDLDFLICEATYGARSRPNLTGEERRKRFAEEINEALARNGVLLIPSFAIERTQELLVDLLGLMDRREVPSLPVFLDSPLAIRATEVFGMHMNALEDLDGRKGLFQHPNLHYCETVEQSKAIARYREGAIILAASGMCEAGRIRHHLKRCLAKRSTTVLIVGYQAMGTLGSLLLQGKSSVRIMGEDVAVRAAIRQIDLYSGHADGQELAQWVFERQPVKRATYLTHGEPEELEALRQRLTAAGGTPDSIFIPKLDDEVNLLSRKPSPKARKQVRRLPPEAVRNLDWHNKLAQFSLDLRESLESATDEKARAKILRRVKRALESDGKS